jgi:methyl-accepting chemotaxis protein
VLTQMVPTINKTSELVQEIAAASGEQATGVNQITTAMGHLNSATQQNASASEELSATAEELSGQAGQLQEMMAFFRLDRSASAPAPSVRNTAGPARAPRAAPPARFSAPAGDAEPRGAARAGGAATWGRPSGGRAVDEAGFGRF